MKSLPKNILNFGILFAILSFFIQCDTTDEPFLNTGPEMLQVDQETGYSMIHFDFARTNINNLPYENLSYKEEEGLQWLREEEKIGSDFYTLMNSVWRNKIFEKLKYAERSHFNASIILLDKYLLTDPVENLDVGEFNHVGLSAFYVFLSNEGSLSLASAYKTSALYEEANIKTLQNQLSSITNNSDIRLFCQSLLSASRNHLRIAVTEFEKQGETYLPQILNDNEYSVIITSGWDMHRYNN